ncbi:uncharacterized protein TM35_000041710 [Trypanosoma theileri]|uniref:C3H1-type domain-containing protein n=1 Tax=Trypanosoma theileri TaxID=67003 RepID=A0A1X0P4U1_9TRYP|nr:uncharacterized protein TM35_000041710 [Trypanosoma theileri]ORC91957.1 hypothetical protein TM35_000041710 [Trypanosoma theileri]
MTQIITENLRTSVPPAAPKSQRVCRHFARGRCTWGSSCRFSHDVERAAVDDVQVNQTFIRIQQQQLQKERHAILKAALDGEFEIKPYSATDGYQRHMVQLRISSSPIFIPRLLSEEALQQQLIELEGNEQLRIGGLLFLVGEPAVFWSMMQLYSVRRTTTSAKWDTLLANAKRGYVECMFFRSIVGCLSVDCPFSHSTTPTVTLTTPLQNMATNNALLAPLLGFGVASTSKTTGNTTATAAATTVATTTNLTSGMCPPVDPTRHVTLSSLTIGKGDDAVVFRDPVWGTCAIPEIRSTTEQQQQQQESVSIPWDSSVRGLAETLW